MQWFCFLRAHDNHLRSEEDITLTGCRSDLLFGIFILLFFCYFFFVYVHLVKVLKYLNFVLQIKFLLEQTLMLL